MPSPRAFWPLTITAANDTFAFLVSFTPFTASLTQGTTYSDPEAYASAIAAAMEAVISRTWTATISAAGRITISAFEVWRPTASDGWAQAGFTSLPGGLANAQTGNVQMGNGWWAERAGTDSKPWFRADAPQTVSKAGNVKTLSISEHELRDVEFQMLRNYKAKIDAESAARALDGQIHTNEAIERLWRDGRGRFRWWPDATVAGTYADFALDGEGSLKEFAPPRAVVAKELYNVRLRFRKWV